MRAPILFEDYEADIQNNGKRSRRVLVTLTDSAYQKDKKHKPSHIRGNTVVYGCEFILDDNQRFEEVLPFIETILHDQMMEDNDIFKNRVIGDFPEDKKQKFKDKIGEATNQSLSARQHMKKLKDEGVKYMIIEDLENNILVRCDELI